MSVQKQSSIGITRAFDGPNLDDIHRLFAGIVTVCESQQFAEQLPYLRAYIGEPVELRCRLEPWVSGNTPDSETAITWFHFGTPLSPELQNLLGIKTECKEGVCTLRIEKVSRRFGGIYRCEALNKFGICKTCCRLLIDRMSFCSKYA